MKSNKLFTLLILSFTIFISGCLETPTEEKLLVFKTTTGGSITTSDSISISFKQTTSLDYNSDFSGEIEIVNNSKQDVIGWEFEFNSSIPISMIYDCNIVSSTPKNKITNKDYNKTIAASGGKIILAFDAKGIPASNIISNAKFNSADLNCNFIVK